MSVCYLREFGAIANGVLFVLVSILQVCFVGVLFELQILFIYRSWSKEVCLAILMFLYLFSCVITLGIEPKIPRI